MGLIFEMSVYDLGYLEHTRDYPLYPQYEEGCRIFCDTFLEEAYARCPVRTGYLRSTISADYTASSITCMAEADYAQYVEYGTSRQSAQPYFEPALQIALETAQEYWDRAENDAIDRQRKLVRKGGELKEEVTGFGNSWYEEITMTDFFSMLFMNFLLSLLKWAIEYLIENLFSVYDDTFREQPDNDSHDFSSVSSFIEVY